MPVWSWIVALVVLAGATTVVAVRSGDGGHSSSPLPTRPPASSTSSSAPATEAPETTTQPTRATVLPVPSPPVSPPSPTDPTSGAPPATTTPAAPSSSAGSGTESAGLPHDLVVTDHWYYPSGPGMYEFGGIVENRGTSTAAGFIAIDVDFYDASGRIVRTESAFVDMVVPGWPTPFSSLLIDPVAEPTRMDARVSDDTFIDAAPGPQGTITVDHVSMSSAAGYVDVSGDATSTFEVDLDYVGLVALWRGADGAVEFGATGYLERLPAGAVEAFTVTGFGDDLPTTPPTEIVVAP
jgi:hypothetical protein